MRSFIGAFKVLSCVIPGCSTPLATLDDTVAGREANEMIQWTDDLRTSFPQRPGSPIHYPHHLAPQTWRSTVDCDGQSCVKTWNRRHPICHPWWQATLGRIFQRQTTRLTDSVATMWGGSFSYRRCHQALQPLPNTVSSWGLHTDRQQTMRTGVWKALPRRVLRKPPCVYLPIYCEPILGLCKTRIRLRNTAFRFLQP